MTKTIDQIAEKYAKGVMAHDSNERKFVKARIKYAILEATEQLRKELADAHDYISKLVDERIELKQLRSLKRDKGRLDWLDNNWFEFVYGNPVDATKDLKDLRTAIDAAKGQQQ